MTDPEAAAAPDDRPAIRGGTWHAFLSAFCIVLAAVLVPVSILGAWVRVELVDEIRFVATLAPLADALRGLLRRGLGTGTVGCWMGQPAEGR